MLSPSSPTQPGSTPAMTYYPTMDGLRFLAFLLVLLHHLPRAPVAVLGFLHEEGWVGVHVFLVLSAYLLARILTSEQARLGAISIRRFYIRRCLRIWPLYFTASIASFVLAICLYSWSTYRTWRFVGLMFFVDNIVTGFWAFNPLPYTPHLWTISLEEQFYLILPFLLRRSLRDSRKFFGWMLALWVGFIGLRILCVLLKAPHPLIWTSFFSADSLLIGTVLGVTQWKPPSNPLARGLLLAGCVVGMASAGFFPGIAQPGWHQVVVYSCVAIGSALLLLAALYEPLLAFLGWRPFRYLGRISYGLYVFHFVGLHAATKVQELIGWSSWWFHAGVSLATAVAIASLSYKFLEKPFLRLKQRFETFHTHPV